MWLPRKWLGAKVAIVGDFGLREEVPVVLLGYGICILRQGRFPKIVFYVLELLHMDTDVRYCVFGDCICLMYYLIDSNDYGCWFG